VTPHVRFLAMPCQLVVSAVPHARRPPGPGGISSSDVAHGETLRHGPRARWTAKANDLAGAGRHNGPAHKTHPAPGSFECWLLPAGAATRFASPVLVAQSVVRPWGIFQLAKSYCYSCKAISNPLCTQRSLFSTHTHAVSLRNISLKSTATAYMPLICFVLYDGINESHVVLVLPGTSFQDSSC
jgi:hypothetical protein